MINKISRSEKEGSVYWITGLSGAGKTTLAQEVTILLKKLGKSVVILDGDSLREVFGVAADNNNNHDRKGRLDLALQYGRLSLLLASQGFTVVIATISLFREVHAWNRENLPDYFEVFLKVPIDELRRRDPKGIYRRFDNGELVHIAGLDIEVDEPLAADLVMEFDPNNSPKLLADLLIKALRIKEKI
jgi:adenylylsulfate kinase